MKTAGVLATDKDKIEFLLEMEASIFSEDLYAVAMSEEAVVSEEIPLEKRPKYITNYIGSKQKLVDWIWKSTPEGIQSIFDGFSGSGVVSYMYKTKGLRVTCNDRLKYSYHAARALIENNSTRLSADDINKLVAKNPNAKNFVQTHFKGLFFGNGVHATIDNVRSNIDALQEYKKDIALLALARTCMGAKGGFAHFSASDSNHPDRKYDTPDEFNARFEKLCNRINSLIFDNGKENIAHNEDIMELAPRVVANLAYFDPPYATQFSTTNYEKAYHFLEGLMNYWEGKEINQNSKVHSYRIEAGTVTKKNANEFFGNFLSKAKKIKYWLISYRDKSFPNDEDMKKIIADQGKNSKLESKDHKYYITSKQGEASQAQEYLYICTPGQGSSFAATEGESLHAEAVESKAIWEETGNEIRFRVHNPDLFDPDSFRRKTLDGVEGISIIIARYKPENVPEGKSPTSSVTQAYRFDRKTEGNPKGWVLEDAKKWIAEHVKTADNDSTSEKYQEDNPKAEGITSQANNEKLHASFEANVKLSANADQHTTGDKQFEFILCHSGTNANGDHFLVEELQKNYKTAINTKVNLSHLTGITDIVGGVLSANFLQDSTKARVECMGELYTEDTAPAQLAYKLMKKSIIKQVSMECDYEAGECSICKKMIRNKGDYCVHLKKFKGGDYEGEPVYEILHGVSFTGLGLLDKKGADGDAKITTVSDINNKSKGKDMKNPKTKADDNDKENTPDEKTPETKAPEHTEELAAKNKEIEDLKNQVTALKAKVAELENQMKERDAEAQAATRADRANKLVEKMEAGGIEFDENSRKAEINRLANMNDEVFEATQTAIDKTLPAKSKADDSDSDADSNKSEADKKKSLKANAKNDPLIIPDKDSSFAEELESAMDACM